MGKMVIRVREQAVLVFQGGFLLTKRRENCILLSKDRGGGELKKAICWSISGIVLGVLYFGSLGVLLGAGENPRLARTSLDYVGFLFCALLLGVVRPGITELVFDFIGRKPQRADRSSVLLMTFFMLLVCSLFISGTYECDRQGCGYYFNNYFPPFILTFSFFFIGVVTRLSGREILRFKKFLCGSR